MTIRNVGSLLILLLIQDLSTLKRSQFSQLLYRLGDRIEAYVLFIISQTIIFHINFTVQKEVTTLQGKVAWQQRTSPIWFSKT